MKKGPKIPREGNIEHGVQVCIFLLGSSKAEGEGV